MRDLRRAGAEPCMRKGSLSGRFSPSRKRGARAELKRYSFAWKAVTLREILSGRCRARTSNWSAEPWRSSTGVGPLRSSTADSCRLRSCSTAADPAFPESASFGARTMSGPTSRRIGSPPSHSKNGRCRSTTQSTRGKRVIFTSRQKGRGASSGAATALELGNIFTVRNREIVRMEIYQRPEEALEAVGLSE
jgi:hypothetical protein